MIRPVFFYADNKDRIQPYAITCINRAVALGCEVFVLTEKETEKTREFKSIWKHFANTNPKFEWDCFIRWVTLYEFAKEKGIFDFWYFDNDVFLLRDPNTVHMDFSLGLINKAQPEGSYSVSGHSSFWQTDRLSNFVDFLFTSYKDTRRLESIWDEYRKTGNPGGVCDMTLLALFEEDYMGGSKNLLSLSPAFDYYINRPNGHLSEDQYEMDGKFKKIYREGGKIFFNDLERGRKIETISIHFQGESKSLLPNFVEQFKNSAYIV